MSEIKGTQQHPKVEIAVKNFGPIAEADIDLRPLTVFVGPSNTGKNLFFYARVCITRYLRGVRSASLIFCTLSTSEQIFFISIC